MYKVAAPHIRRVIVLGMAAGPRIGPSELFRLAWADVDLAAGYMRMPNAAKGSRDDSRIVPIRDDILPLLRAWKEEDEKQGCPWVIHWQGRPVRCIGHADPTMLLRVYQHTRYRLKKKAVNAAPGLRLDKI